jgi:diadenosine tetraphosphate (Ap4A) HIT family hydrolase
MSDRQPGCPLCESDGGLLVVRSGPLRVIRAQEAGFPAFYRVVWQAHVPEFTDLAPHDRQACMDAVARVEDVVRERLRPHKVNLAALGNLVPHLHWHVIARFTWDSHFPAPVWAAAARAAPPDRLHQIEALLPEVDRAVAARFA